MVELTDLSENYVSEHWVSLFDILHSFATEIANS